MRTITFDAIHARVAEHRAAEAARNTPKAVAIRAVYTLRSALADLSDEERAEVARLAATELATFIGQIYTAADAESLVLCLTAGIEGLAAHDADCLASLETI